MLSHILEHECAYAKLLNNRALEFRRRVHNHFLKWFTALTTFGFVKYHLRLRNLKFVSLALPFFLINRQSWRRLAPPPFGLRKISGGEKNRKLRPPPANFLKNPGGCDPPRARPPPPVFFKNLR